MQGYFGVKPLSLWGFTGIDGANDQRVPHRIIVHADDFGRGSGTTLGVLNCINRGAVTSLTILANLPGTMEAITHAVKLQDRISVGVHLNLCEGQPLTEAPTLVDAGGVFHRKRSVLARVLFRRFSPRELEGELSAQVALIKDAGIEISHLDSHKHLHLLPGISRVVTSVARRFGIERIRCPVNSLDMWRPVSVSATTLARTGFARLAGRQFTAAGLRHPNRMVDLRRLFASGVSRDSRLALVRVPGRLTEIMCHPTADGVREEWSDAAILRSDEFIGFLSESGASLCTYWDC
jgi:predicted glycoside hydrolase/deacetylase ChbG (UPF0249 family)